MLSLIIFLIMIGALFAAVGYAVGQEDVMPDPRRRFVGGKPVPLP